MTPDAAHMSYLELHCEAAALRAENEALREDLAKLITDRDYLIHAATFYDHETGEVNEE